MPSRPQGEAGGFILSGITSTKGVAIGLTLARETLKWKHTLRGFVDYRRQNGMTSRERYLASYEGDHNISSDLYALLTLSYERDPFQGSTGVLRSRWGLATRSSTMTA